MADFLLPFEIIQNQLHQARLSDMFGSHLAFWGHPCRGALLGVGCFELHGCRQKWEASRAEGTESLCAMAETFDAANGCVFCVESNVGE